MIPYEKNNNSYSNLSKRIGKFSVICIKGVKVLKNVILQEMINLIFRPIFDVFSIYFLLMRAFSGMTTDFL